MDFLFDFNPIVHTAAGTVHGTVGCMHEGLEEVLSLNCKQRFKCLLHCLTYGQCFFFFIFARVLYNSNQIYACVAFSQYQCEDNYSFTCKTPPFEMDLL